jgi:hypothetical protein
MEMKKQIIITFILALVTFGVLNAQSLPTNQFFHRQGQEIIHPDGKKFQIKGVNVSCWLYQENYVLGGAQTAQKVTAERVSGLIGKQTYHQYIKNMMDSFLLVEDIQLMKQMGINCVRLGFDAELFNDEDTKMWFFNSIDRLLPAFKENDIAILPIMMVPPKAPDKLWCTGYVKGDTMLWDSPYAKKRTIKIWSEIGEHYKNERMILGYDLIGEPAIDKKRERELIDLYKDISAGIRAHDTNHMIVYEGNNYAIDLSVLSKYNDILDKNGCYSFHLYTWLGLKMKNHLPKFMKNASLSNRPVFCGEWGINKITTIKEQVDLMNAEKDMDGWIIYMWKALELPIGNEEKKRPPYYGNWFFIPFKKLNMSLITFKIDNETRDVIDWMSGVKKAKTPSIEMTIKELNNIVRISQVSNCKLNRQLIETLGFKMIKN